MCEIVECCVQGGCECCGELLFGVASLPFNIVYGVGSGVVELGSELLNTASICCNFVQTDICLTSMQVCEMTSDCVSFLDFKNCCPKFSNFPRSKERYNLPSDQRVNSGLPVDIVVANQPGHEDYNRTIADISESNAVKNNNDPHALDDIDLGFVLKLLEANARRNVCNDVPNICL